MRGFLIRLDHSGIGSMLRSGPVRSAVKSAAHNIAGEVQGEASVQRHSMPVEVESYTTDRAAAAVVVAHPGALGADAKHGILSKHRGG